MYFSPRGLEYSFSFLGTSQFDSGDGNENDYAINTTSDPTTTATYTITNIIIIKNKHFGVAHLES